MAKKLLGDRFIGDATFEKDTVLSDEAFAASGLAEADVVNVPEADAVAAAETAAPAASADKEAELDSAAGKNDTSASGGSDADDTTIEHTLTDEDFVKNPALAEQGLKAGDKIRIPKEA